MLEKARYDWLETALRRSDLAYFKAGAESRRTAGATVHWMPGLQHLAAGCIVEPTDLKVPPEEFVAEASAWLSRIGSPLFRFYAPATDGRQEAWLRGAGFDSCIELGVAKSVSERPRRTATPGLKVRAVEDSIDWHTKAELAKALSRLPDGKSADALDWTELEKRKAETGYARFWMIEREGTVCGTFGLSVSQGFLRLKNLAVHPKFRRCGVGTAAIDFACDHAAGLGLEWLGAFAMAGGAGDRLYRASGFDLVGAQTEWSRPTAPITLSPDERLAASQC